MEKFEQFEETKRFLEVVDYLLSKHIVESDADFCRKISYSQQSFNQFRKQKRNVTVELISKLYSIFDANPLFIFSGEGEKLIDPSINLVGESPMGYGKEKNQSSIVTELLAQIQTLRKVNELLVSNGEISGKYIAELEAQLKQIRENVRKENSG